MKKRSTDENGSQKCGGEGGTGVWWGRGAKSREVCNFGGWVIIFDLSTFKRPKRKDFYAVAVGPKKPVFSVGVLGKNSKQLRFSARLRSHRAGGGTGCWNRGSGIKNFREA